MDVQATRVSDPHSFDPDPDPAFRLETNPDPIRVKGFNDQKLKKNTVEVSNTGHIITFKVILK